MKIAVCVKQIPDPTTPYQLDPTTHFVSRPQDQVLDDTDRYGVEVGLQLAEATGGTVVLVSMCPAGNLQGIRQALAMGADKAVIVNDPALRGSGALVTAKVLAAVLRKERRPGHRGHRVDRRLFRASSPSRSPRCSTCPHSPSPARSPTPTARSHRAPDGLGIRRGEAPLPVLVA